jgi:VanZ family protein
MRSYLRRYLPAFVTAAALYWAAIFVLTHVPGGPDPGIEHLDKVVHFTAYLLLAFAIGSVLTVWRGFETWIPFAVWTVCVAYGAIDEYTQRFVPSRTASLADLACDAAGAAVGVTLVYCCVLALRRYRTMASGPA